MVQLLRYFTLFVILVVVYLATQIISQPKIAPRVSHGERAQQLQWPSQVLILTGKNIGRICGGSVLNNEWVLTAGHCVRTIEDGEKHEPLKYKLIFGEYNRFVEDGEIYRNIAKIIQHPNYETQNHSFDVALLKMDTPVEFSKKVKPVCLDLKGVDIRDTKCYLTGFGRTSQHDATSSSIPHVLQQLKMKPFDHEECAKIHHQFYEQEQSKEEVTDKQICMVSVNKPKQNDYSKGGGCPGDSGGPLQCLVNSAWFQVGVSWSGTDCETHPSVFNLVKEYAEFILKETNYTLPKYCGATFVERKG